MSGSTKGTPKVRLNAALFAMALEELMTGPTTRYELEETTGLSRQTVLSLISALRKRKLIRIGGWERDRMGKASMAAFVFGQGEDARKPRPLTPSEVQKAYKMRKLRAQTFYASAANDDDRRAA